ncbi:STAS domain-containing protein [Olsenella umbonata]|uniref:Anti-sigma factor antagonist n=1 Tax=Parafannyhessea umbonata TaxID=604330 RepID=A0A7X9T8X5_9ACTN|nr:STAS domain-containing protein [Parafannyhessea umbonata]NMF25053.1 STAS domain-containing protein [Parafannyhessea umbonata]
MEILTTKAENGRKVQVAGEVDVSNASKLRDAIDELLAKGVPSVDVDLSQVSYIDSTGIGVLVGAVHRAHDAGLSLVVSNPQRNVARVLDMLGVSGELGIEA